MNQIIPFTYEGNNIRTVTENGTPLFCGKDVAAALGYYNPGKAVRDHCKGGSVLDPPLRLQVEHRKHASSLNEMSTD